MQKKIPIGSRILLKPKIEETTESGIIKVVDKRRASIDCDVGQIVAIGDKAFGSHPLDYRDDDGVIHAPIKPGDWVYYAKYGARKVEFDDEPDVNYMACNDEDILMRLEDE